MSCGSILVTPDGDPPDAADGPVRVVVNPAAGTGRPRPELDRALDRLPEAVEVRVARDRGDTGRLARRAEADGCRRLVVVGGDGTVHEAVAALREPSGGMCLGVVPAGTGNDFARALGLPREPVRALEVALRGPARRVDLLEASVGGRTTRAVNFVLGGTGGEVARSVTASRKRRWRRLVYLRALVDELLSVRSRELAVTADGEVVSSGPHLLVLVANGPSLGNGIPAVPPAQVDDGRLDLLTVRGGSAAALAGVLARLAAARHLESPRVAWRRARRVRVRGDADLPFNGDGESLGRGEGAFRVLPGALPVAAPGAGSD